MNMQARLNAGMENLAQRVKEARTRLGLSQTALALASGMQQADISKIENGKILRTTGAIALARALGCDPYWLDTGEGEPSYGAVSNVEDAPSSRHDVPLISWVHAGAWCGAEDPFSPGEAEAWMPCPAAHSPGTFALRVRGDSMTAPSGNSRTYPENCVIYVDPQKNSPNNGDRIIAKLNGSDEVTFKVYKEEDGRRWLMPLNPAHLPIREEFSVCGTVIGKWEDG